MSNLYVSLQICFGPCISCSLATPWENSLEGKLKTKIIGKIRQNVHCCTLCKPIHLRASQSKSWSCNRPGCSGPFVAEKENFESSKRIGRPTLTTIALSWSLWYLALCCASPDFEPLTFPQILHGHGIPLIWVSVWRLRFACKKNVCDELIPHKK